MKHKPVPVWMHESPRCIIHSYGRLLTDPYAPENTDSALRSIGMIGGYIGASSVLWQRLASDKRPEGRWQVHSLEAKLGECFVTRSDSVCDAVIIKEVGHAVAFLTRDCPVLILESSNTPSICVIHCGRDSLHGIDTGNPRKSVISEALQLWKVSDASSIRGALTLSIGAQYFTNDRYPFIVSELREHWGNRVVFDPNTCAIDLVELILSQLREAGIAREHIAWDTLDTYSDRRLSSMRARRDDTHNVVLVCKK